MKLKFTYLLIVFTQAVFCQSNISFDWTHSGGGADHDFVRCITIDSQSNIYIAGFFSDSADLDPSIGVTYYVSNGYRDAFVTKLNPQGIPLWIRTFGGAGYDLIQAIDVDELDNVYITGFFSDSFSLDVDTSSINIISKGDKDAFVGKLSSTGEMSWFKTLGATGEDYGYSISARNGKVCIGGTFNQTIFLSDFASNDSLVSTGGRDAYIIYLDTLGNYVWSVDYGGVLSDYNYAVEIDQNGNVFAGGAFRNLVDFDPGPNFDYHVSSGLFDAYILSLNPSGDFNWCKTIGGVGDDIYRDIELKNDKIYITGFFKDSIELMLFDSSSVTIGSKGGFDILITQYDTTAQLNWFKTAGSVNDDLSYALKADVQGVIVQGNFSDTLFFSDSNYHLISQGGSDIFLCKFDNSNNIEWSFSTGGTDAEYSSGFGIASSGKIISAGYFYGDGDFGYDTTYTLSSLGESDFFVQSLDYCATVYTIDELIVCDSYTWPLNRITYTITTNTPTATLSNAAGCDSIVTLDLTITNSTSGTDTQTVCNSFLWLDGHTYTSSNNTATHTLSNGANCDSVVTLDLTINTVDSSVTQSDSILSAVVTGASYQWLNCTNNFSIISGETNQSYTTTTHGNYAVEITQNGCVDTSACYAITSVGIIDNSFGNQLLIYPNPTDGNFWIDLGRNYQTIRITMTDLNGKLIHSKTYNESQLLNLKLTESDGVYLLIIESGDKKAVIRLVKE